MISRAAGSSDDNDHQNSCVVCLDATADFTLSRCRACPCLTCKVCFDKLKIYSGKCPQCYTQIGAYRSDDDIDDNLNIQIISTFQRNLPVDLEQFKEYHYSGRTFYMNKKNTIIHEMTTEQKSSILRDLLGVIDSKNNTALDIVILLVQRYKFTIREEYSDDVDVGTFHVTLTKRPQTQFDQQVETIVVSYNGYSDVQYSLFKSYLNDDTTKASPSKVARKLESKGVMRKSAFQKRRDSAGPRNLDDMFDM